MTTPTWQTWPTCHNCRHWRVAKKKEPAHCARAPFCDVPECAGHGSAAGAEDCPDYRPRPTKILTCRTCQNWRRATKKIPHASCAVWWSELKAVGVSGFIPADQCAKYKRRKNACSKGKTFERLVVNKLRALLGPAWTVERMAATQAHKKDACADIVCTTKHSGNVIVVECKHLAAVSERVLQKAWDQLWASTKEMGSSTRELVHHLIIWRQNQGPIMVSALADAFSGYDWQICAGPVRPEAHQIISWQLAEVEG